jgi:DNA-binding winged helix-turn-helix (wHTH) protein/tetratricopeptide (TPR) repeat protein
MQEKPNKNHIDGGGYRFADFELFPADRRLRRRGKSLAVAPKVFDALLVFVRSPERLIRRDILVETLWPDTFVTDANLTNIIVSLRKILGREAIQTVSKFGYRLTVPVTGEPGVDPGIYESFMRAKALAAVRTIPSMQQARDLCSVCVARDPAFAAAWAWLGRCCRFLEKFNVDASLNRDLADAAFQRALVIDPDLAAAHHFYTQLQADSGRAQDAMIRLAGWIVRRGDEPEAYAGLTQVLRFCGLLDDSVAAHERATALDPTIQTSVTHTHFLRGAYKETLQTYGSGARYYLDAAAWMALGDIEHARSALRERLQSPQLAALMRGLMGSLLAVLDGRHDEALAIIAGLDIDREPEVLFYLARHCGLLGAPRECVALIRRAREGGFGSSQALERDDAFALVRRGQEFAGEINAAKAREKENWRVLKATGYSMTRFASPTNTGDTA